MAIRARSKAPRCPGCFLHLHYCICKESPHFELKTKVTLFMTNREQFKTTNSGRLCNLALANTSTVIVPRELVLPSAEEWLDSECEPLLLFPWGNSEDVATELPPTKKPFQLIVPDGTWKECRKLAGKIMEQRAMKSFTVSREEPTKYQLRRGGRPGGLCTFEAISEALGVIENDQIKIALLQFFDRMVQNTLRMRGIPKKLAAA